MARIWILVKLVSMLRVGLLETGTSDGHSVCSGIGRQSCSRNASAEEEPGAEICWGWTWPDSVSGYLFRVCVGLGQRNAFICHYILVGICGVWITRVTYSQIISFGVVLCDASRHRLHRHKHKSDGIRCSGSSYSFEFCTVPNLKTDHCHMCHITLH